MFSCSICSNCCCNSLAKSSFLCGLIDAKCKTDRYAYSAFQFHSAILQLMNQCRRWCWMLPSGKYILSNKFRYFNSFSVEAISQTVRRAHIHKRRHSDAIMRLAAAALQKQMVVKMSSRWSPPKVMNSSCRGWNWNSAIFSRVNFDQMRKPFDRLNSIKYINELMCNICVAAYKIQH